MAKFNCFTYVWTVENVNSFYHRPVKSPPFQMQSIENDFFVELRLQDNDEHDLMSFSLLGRSDNGFEEMEYKLSILDSDGSCLIEEKFDSGERDKLYVPRDEVFVKRKNTYLPKNTLTLQCKMRIVQESERLSQAGYCFARTRLRIERVSLPWLIENFGISDNDSKFLLEVQRPSFKNSLIRAEIFWQRCCENRLKMKFIPYFLNDDGTSMYNDDDSSDEDESDEEDGKDVFLDCYTCKISSDTLGQKKCILDETRFDLNSIETITLPLTRNMLLEEPSKYLMNNALSLNCLFTFYYGASAKETEFTSYVNDDHPDYNSRSFNDDADDGASTLKDDLRSLYDGHVLCDFTILAEGRSFSVHKNILLSRSPVLRSEIMENGKQELHVSDRSDTIHRFLLYLYTDKVDDMEWENALQLYVTAEKFKVPTLMKKCSLILKEKLTIRNVCDILVVAHDYHDEDMKSSIRDFILGHDVAIFNSAKWIEMENIHSSIAAETLRRIYLKKGDRITS